MIALTRDEALKRDVSVQTRLATDLPTVDGDRVPAARTEAAAAQHAGKMPV